MLKSGRGPQLGNNSTIVQRIVEEIRNTLIRGELRPGMRLPTENELVQKYSVSRNALREAIKMLVAQGLLEIRRAEGTFVRKGVSSSIIEPLLLDLILEGGTPKELLELRKILEIGILEVILINITDEDIGKMEKAIALLEIDYKREETDSQILREHDLSFHYAYVEATHNHLIIRIARTIWEMFSYSIEKSLKIRSKLRQPPGHKKILEGIKERNLKKARKAVYESLRTWKENVYGSEISENSKS